MKIQLALLIATLGIYSSALGQGALTPPGAPAPTMKTLAQIEPRTPISSAPFTITNPGSYYLTTNLTVSSGNAITIATNGVALDLGGFILRSTATSATGYGILISGGLQNLTIANGFIQGGVTNNGTGVFTGGGFNHGIYYSGSLPVNVLVSRVAVTGCQTYGIYLYIGNGTVVESCTVRTVGGSGIMASTIKQCSAIDCGSAAIYGDQAADCRGESTGGSYGVVAYAVQNCYGYSLGGYAIYAQTAQNCFGYSTNSGAGISAITALNCSGSGDGSAYGLTATTANNCYGYSSGSGIGLSATGTASGCYGYSSTGIGLFAYNAAFCTGYRPGGAAIQATIANGCIAYSGTNSITYKYNMP